MYKHTPHIEKKESVCSMAVSRFNYLITNNLIHKIISVILEFDNLGA